MYVYQNLKIEKHTFVIVERKITTPCDFGLNLCGDIT